MKKILYSLYIARSVYLHLGIYLHRNVRFKVIDFAHEIDVIKI